MNFRDQWEALVAAQIVIPKLPAHTVWSLTMTEDDNPSVLNIYADPWEWPTLARTLASGPAVDIGDTFQSYRLGTLLVSIIQKESI
jgi:hypothetical protein